MCRDKNFFLNKRLLIQSNRSNYFSASPDRRGNPGSAGTELKRMAGADVTWMEHVAAPIISKISI